MLRPHHHIRLSFSILFGIQVLVKAHAVGIYYERKIENLTINGVETELSVSVTTSDGSHVIDPDQSNADYGSGGITVSFGICAVDEQGALPPDIKVIEAMAYHSSGSWDMTTSKNKEIYRWSTLTGYSNGMDFSSLYGIVMCQTEDS